MARKCSSHSHLSLFWAKGPSRNQSKKLHYCNKMLDTISIVPNELWKRNEQSVCAQLPFKLHVKMSKPLNKFIDCKVVTLRDFGTSWNCCQDQQLMNDSKNAISNPTTGYKDRKMKKSFKNSSEMFWRPKNYIPAVKYLWNGLHAVQTWTLVKICGQLSRKDSKNK